jgi:integrase
MASIQKRVTADGKVTFRVQVRIKGFPPDRATFERLTDAKRWAQKTETEMRERRYFKTAESKNKTLAELIDRYLDRVQKQSPKRYSNLKPMLTWWKAELGHAILADLTKAKIVEKLELLSKRKKTRTSDVEKAAKVEATISPARVNRYLAALSHCMTVAVNEWEWLENNPIRKISKLKEPRGRTRFLSDDERKAFLKACQNSDYKPLYLIVVLALSTGARKSEIMNLRWADVDFSKRQIVLHETKNGDRRVLPMAGLALDLVKEHSKVRDLKTDLLFPFGKPPKPYEIRPPFEKAVKEAGLKDFRFHDLRHSAASYMAMNGASPAEIAEVLGHKTLQMVKRYAHLSEAHTHSVVASMNERIFGEK